MSWYALLMLFVHACCLRGPRTRTINDFDEATVVPFFGFDGLDDYYRCSSLGHLGKLARAAVPLLALHAADDPIIDSASFRDHLPAITVADGSAGRPSHLFVLLTRRGCHIGWCEGRAPGRRRWGFVHRVVAEFVGAVAEQMSDGDDARWRGVVRRTRLPANFNLQHHATRRKCR